MEQDYNSALLDQMEDRLKNDPEARAEVEELLQAASGTGAPLRSTPGILYNSRRRVTDPAELKQNRELAKYLQDLIRENRGKSQEPETKDKARSREPLDTAHISETGGGYLQSRAFPGGESLFDQSPEVLARFTKDEDGLEAVVTKREKRCHATLRDTDAGQSIESRIYPTLEAATAYAKDIAGQTPLQKHEAQAPDTSKTSCWATRARTSAVRASRRGLP